MAQIFFIHKREDRPAADFILRCFAATNIKPLVVECSDETLIFEPGKQFEQTVNNMGAVFILFTSAMANNKFLRSQIESVCNFAAAKDVWLFEPAEQLGKVSATIKSFKHLARFEISDGWASYLQEAIKFYDDSSVPVLLATTAAGGALMAQSDKVAGGFYGLLAGLGLLCLNNSNRAEFGQPIICRNCSRSFRVHLTEGTKEFRCAACGIFYLTKNSAAFNRLIQRKKLKNGKPLPPIVQETNLLMTEQFKTPTAFISYSWDSDEHKNWVREFAARLRGEGVDVTLDQWHLTLGDPLPEFMERAVRENDFVLVVCTPNYKAKADERKGGVGYEGNIMTGELFIKYNHRKFIPILRHANWAEAAPTWLQAKTYIDLTDRRFEDNFERLAQTLHGEKPELPPLGKRSSEKSFAESPKTAATKKSKPMQVAGVSDETNEQAKNPIKIIEIVNAEITKPKMDGTRGSGLYAVPFRLSSRPAKEWAQIFVQTWNNPPRFTSMHRPGIAKVTGDKIILDGTTIEEVEKYHRDTLLAVIEKTNQEYGEYQARLKSEAERKRQREGEHDASIGNVLKRIKFE